MDINSLPDFLLQKIFSALPLGCILRLHQVCTKWASIQSLICLQKDKVCITVSQFDIPNNFDQQSFEIPYIEHLVNPPENLIDLKIDCKENQLQFDWLDSDFATLIAMYLPNVTALHLSLQMVPINKYYGERSWNQIENIIEPLTILFQSWATQLQVIKLFIHCKEDHFNEKKIISFYTSFFGFVNTCISLKNLTLESINSINNEKPSFDLPVLGWIEKLNVNFFDFNATILANLLKYGLNNEKLKSISLINFYQPTFEFFLKNENSHHLTSKFHQLVNYNFCINTDDADTVLKNFKFLQRLHFRVYAIDEIIPLIRRISQLKCLLFADMYLGLEKNDWNSLAQVKFNNDTKLSLDSVKIIRTYAPECSHVTVHSFYWHEIFPNLEVLCYIDGENCALCNEIAETAENENVVRKECLRKTLKTWLKCPNLKIVISQSPGDITVFWNIDDLKKT